VYQNPEFEIGWFPIRTLDSARRHPFFSHFPAEFTALHWHGDTFDLPAGATLLASTGVCANQAFVCRDHVVGLQFHIEVRPEDVRSFVQGETGPLPAGRYVQSFEQILGGDRHIPAVHGLLGRMLEAMTARA
jgi:GMP synthase-like glutamine amidotransferase